MNLKFCFLAFFICFLSLVNAQNLVPNNSFEEIEKCLVYEIPYKFHMKNWWTPNKGTPDIFSANCITKFNMPKNYGGKSYPAHGEAYVGIVVYSAEKNQNPKDSTDFNYAEYLQTKLKQKLVKDSVYRVSFFYQLGTNSRYSSSGLGVHFSRKKIKSNTNFLDIEANASVQHNDHPTGNWLYFTYDYTATGKEQILTIGRFGSTKGKQIKNIAPNTHWFEKNNAAIYFIDYVDVKLWHKRDTFEFLCVEALNKKLNILDTLQVDSTAKFIINNDFFDTETNQFILNEDSNDLKNLSSWLAKDSLYTIEISTHIFTDENSPKTYLQSKLRNDAFTNYLLQNGVSPKQIKNKIYTNQQPIITLKNQYYNDFNTRLQLRFLYTGEKYRTKILITKKLL